MTGQPEQDIDLRRQVGDERAIEVLMQAGVDVERASAIVAAGGLGKELITLAAGSMLTLVERIQELDVDEARALVFAYATTLAMVRETTGSFNGRPAPR